LAARRPAQKNWRTPAIKDTRINGLAIANEHVVVAGALLVGGHIQLIKKATGEPIAALQLDSVPIYDGLAVADAGIGEILLGVESAGRKRPDLDGDGKADVLQVTCCGYIVLMEAP
jgi:hypothetical protein